jgi:prefoldin subunit 5
VKAEERVEALADVIAQLHREHQHLHQQMGELMELMKKQPAA